MNESPARSNPRLLAVLSAIVLCILPLTVFAGFGTEQLEKWLTANLLPVGLLWNAFLLSAIFQYWRGFKNRSIPLFIHAALIWIVGNPVLGYYLMLHQESQFATVGPLEVLDRFDAIVMLGGCTGRLPGGRAEVTSEGQRLVSSVEFFHADKASWIITTGRRNDDDPGDESLVAANIMIGLGVPIERILRLPASNTYEEIVSVKQLLNEHPEKFPSQRIGIVTSAFHMPRAMRLAKHAELTLIPLPSGHRAISRVWKPTDLVPNAETVSNNSYLFKEFLAGLVGR